MRVSRIRGRRGRCACIKAPLPARLLHRVQVGDGMCVSRTVGCRRWECCAPWIATGCCVARVRLSRIKWGRRAGGGRGRARAKHTGRKILLVAAAFGQKRVVVAAVFAQHGRGVDVEGGEQRALCDRRHESAPKRTDSCGIAWYRVSVHGFLRVFDRVQGLSATFLRCFLKAREPPLHRRHSPSLSGGQTGQGKR